MSEENENKTPVADEVAGRIKEILFSGELSHGQKLPGENKIAERLGVGRSSVREALKQLAAAGYVELVPNRGAFAVVTSSDEMPSPRDGAVRWLSVNRSSVDELLRVRSCIEPFAAELCAGRADKELCAVLAENLSDFEKALRRGQSDKLSKLDYEFHRMILDGSGNRFLVGMYSQLLQLFMQYSRSSFRATDSKLATLAEHRMIYEAIEAGSGEEARYAMSLHISIAVRRLGDVEGASQDTE